MIWRHYIWLCILDVLRCSKCEASAGHGVIKYQFGIILVVLSVGFGLCSKCGKPSPILIVEMFSKICSKWLSVTIYIYTFAKPSMKESTFCTDPHLRQMLEAIIRSSYPAHSRCSQETSWALSQRDLESETACQRANGDVVPGVEDERTNDCDDGAYDA